MTDKEQDRKKISSERMADGMSVAIFGIPAEFVAEFPLHSKMQFPFTNRNQASHRHRRVLYRHT